MTQAYWFWPILILCSAAAAVSVSLTDNIMPLRHLIVLWFMAVCPGMALVRLLDVKDELTEWILAIAVSLSLDASVAVVMLYTGQWSPTVGLMIIVSISAFGVVLQLWRAGGVRADGKASSERN